MAKKASKILKKASQILLDHKWCRNNLCLDKDGNKVKLDDPKVYKIDVTAALYLANNHKWPKDAANIAGGIANDAKYANWNGYYLASFNDSQSITKKKVVQLLDSAMVLALQEENVDLDEYFDGNEG